MLRFQEWLFGINLSDFTVIAADGAAAVLMDMDIVPEVIYTDLDGNSEADIEKEIFACQTGSIVLTHIQGDNVYKLEEYVLLLKHFNGCLDKAFW